MSVEECLINIRSKFSEEDITTEDLATVVTAAFNITNENTLDSNRLIMEFATQMIERRKEEAVNALKGTKRLKDLQLRIGNMTDKNFSFISKKLGVDNQAYAKVEAILEGRGLGGKETNNSVGRVQDTFMAQLSRPIDNLITDLKITPEELASKPFNRDVLKEIYSMNAAEKKLVKGALPDSITGNKKAYALAKLYRNTTFSDIRKMFAMVGKKVAFDENFAGIRKYDVVKVGRNHGAEFVAMLLKDNIDPKTFGIGATMEQKVARANEMYKHIMEGHGADFHRHRSIFFKTADAEADFLEQFSTHDTHYHSVQSQIETSAKVAGMMHVFGADYKKTFKDLMESIGNPASEGGVTAQNMFNDLAGDLVATGENKWGAAGANVRSYLTLTSLWGSSITAFMPDQVAMAALISSVDGKGMLSTFHKTLTSYTMQASPEARRKLGEIMMLNAFDMLTQHNDGSSALRPGTLNRAASKMMRVIGLAQHSDRIRTTIAATLGSTLHDHSGKAFGELVPELVATFERYGINSDNWDILRQAKVDAEGYTLLSPAKVLEMGSVEGLSEAAQKLHHDTYIKMASMVNDYARISTLEGNAYSRQKLYWGMPAGTPIGELLRFTGQFKQASINMMRLQNRLWHSMSGAAYAQTFAAFSMAGYLTYIARDFLVKGLSPEVPDTDTPAGRLRMGILLAESVNRGAGGLVGDLITADYQHSGIRSFSGDMAGPFAGKISSIGKFGAAALRTDIASNKTEMVKFIQASIPGANAPLIKPLISDLAFDFIHNSMDSSYGFRKRANIHKRGQIILMDSILK